MLVKQQRERINLLTEIIEDTHDHYTLSKDKDAELVINLKILRSSDFKTHLAITEEMLIPAAVVTSGEKNDGSLCPSLLSKSEKWNGNRYCYWRWSIFWKKESKTHERE